MVGGIAHVGVLEGLLDLEACQGERANHFKSQETDDINGVVVGFEVQRGWKVEEFAETFRCATR